MQILEIQESGKQTKFLSILEADVELPEEFLKVRGKPWPLVDWMSLNQLRPRIIGD